MKPKFEIVVYEVLVSRAPFFFYKFPAFTRKRKRISKGALRNMASGLGNKTIPAQV